MKRIMILSSLILMSIALLASVDVGALKLREDNNFWRLIHYNGSSSGNGGHSSSSRDYYYNSYYPSALDSLITEEDCELTNFTYRDIYSRQDFDDHYQVTINSFICEMWGIEQLRYRYIYYYNMQDQVTDEYLYTASDLFIPMSHIQYDYNANGDVLAMVTRNSDNQITDYVISEYDANYRLTLQDEYRFISGVDTHTSQIKNFYSAWDVPDSTYFSIYNIDGFYVYLVQNSFDAFGNVLVKTEFAPSQIKTTTTDYVLAQDMHFPTIQTTITEQLSNGIWSPTDTFQTVYTYTNSYHTILQETYRNSEWFQSETLRYNDAWCLLQNQTNGYWYLPDGTYSSNASYTWEFFTTPNDDPVQNAVPALSAYPNPCRDNTNIKYLLKENSAVTMNIYNIKGQKVLSQNLGTKSSGTHDLNITLDQNVFASGIYFVRLTTKQETKNLKLIVIK